MALAWLLLPLRLEAVQLGLDAGLGAQISGPFQSAVAPGAVVSAHWNLAPRWQAGLAAGQHTFFETGYYVSARGLDLRLRRGLGAGAWAELGLGVNFMAWHFSNWPGWGHAALEAGWTWQRTARLGWELGLGLQAWGPPEQGLWLTTLRLGPRWAWGP